MLRVLPLMSLLLLAACDDLGEFEVHGDGVFEGPVLGSDVADAGPAVGCRFILCGFAERTTLQLKNFDPRRAGGLEPTGTLTTSDGTLQAAQLRAVPGLEHDALSQYTFPGGGRVRNYILGAYFGDSDARYAIVFLSLMDDGRIEARIHAPSVVPGGDDALFGVFRMCRGGCSR